MGIIAQKQLFNWKNIENLGDLERIDLVMRYLPDHKLLAALEKKRRNGRNKNPVEPIWNSILAGVIYQHISIESLRRELKRNGELREICGFEGAAGLDAVPSSDAYSRFLRNLLEFEEEIDEMFTTLVKRLTVILPDFGEVLAMDGKAISSLANGKNKLEGKETDGRRDLDANWGKKVYHGNKTNGSAWEKVVSWFGYKLHLIVDANYELPVAFEVTQASVAEQPTGEAMLTKLENENATLLERCKLLVVRYAHCSPCSRF